MTKNKTMTMTKTEGKKVEKTRDSHNFCKPEQFTVREKDKDKDNDNGRDNGNDNDVTKTETKKFRKLETAATFANLSSLR